MTNKYVFKYEFNEEVNTWFTDSPNARIEVSSDDEDGVWISANRDGWDYLAKVCAEFSLDEKLEPGFHHKHFDSPVEVLGVDNNELTFGLETWKRTDENLNSLSGLYVYIVIHSLDCDPNLLTPIMNVEPSDIEKVTDLSKLTGKPRLNPSNCWQFDSDLKDLDLNHHIVNIRNKLGDLSKVKSVSQKFGVKIQCVVDFRCDDNSPKLGLTKESIKILSEWNADIDIDYYLWGKIQGENYQPKKHD